MYHIFYNNVNNEKQNEILEKYKKRLHEDTNRNQQNKRCEYKR